MVESKFASPFHVVLQNQLGMQAFSCTCPTTQCGRFWEKDWSPNCTKLNCFKQ